MKKVIFTITLWFCLISTAYAAEMLMFSTKTCGYCRAFLKEVAPTYADTEHAKLLPLRIISMDQKTAPKWFDEAYVGATSLRNALQYPQVLVENISISAAYAVDVKQNHSAMVKITFFISAPFI